MSRVFRMLGVLAPFLVLAGQASADLHFPEPLVDAGEVKAGAPLAQRFQFVNQGPEAVALVAIQPSCGCLTPRFERRVYQPGEKGCVLMEVNTLGEPTGAHAWKFRVGYRHGDLDQEVALQLNARVTREVNVQPAALTVFADNVVSHEIRLTDARPRPLSIREVRTSSSKVTACLTGRPDNEHGLPGWTIRLEIAGDCPEGRHDEFVIIHTDDPEYAELKVPVTVVKRAKQSLALLPAAVRLSAPPGQPLPSRIVLVRDAGQRAVLLERVVADHPAVTCHWARGPGTSATVRIHVDRNRIAGADLQAQVLIHVRQPEPLTLTLPISCSVK